MADMIVDVDCETGQETLAPLSVDEAAAMASLQQQVAQQAAAEQAKIDDQAAAISELQTLAASGGTVGASLLTRVLGISST